MRADRHATHCSTAPLVAILLALLFAAAGPAAGAARAVGLPDGWPHTAGLRAYDQTLARHVRKGGVDYDGLVRDRRGLDTYLREIAAVDSFALGGRSDAELMAFWINAYNALTLDLVVRNLNGAGGRGPRLRSIRDIPGAWTKPRWVVTGARRTLDEIENRILRGRFREPRIHFALVCASRSCPALRTRAYTGDSLDAELASAARAFLSDTTRNDVRIREGSIRLSKLFEWYEKDFVELTPQISPQPYSSYSPELGQILTYLAGFHYLPDDAISHLRAGGIRIEYLPYDWSLNDASPGR